MEASIARAVQEEKRVVLGVMIEKIERSRICANGYFLGE
jgi:hypothetical protein